MPTIADLMAAIDAVKRQGMSRVDTLGFWPGAAETAGYIGRGLARNVAGAGDLVADAMPGVGQARQLQRAAGVNPSLVDALTSLIGQGDTPVEKTAEVVGPPGGLLAKGLIAAKGAAPTLAALVAATKGAGKASDALGALPDGIRAVVRFGGKEFDGATHIEAIKKAAAEGLVDLNAPKLNRDMGDTIDLFRVPGKGVRTRDEVGALYDGAKRTEDLRAGEAARQAEADAPVATTVESVPSGKAGDYIDKGVGRSKTVVGTTGKSVGAPPGVTPADEQAIIDRYKANMMTGVEGRTWYEDQSKDLIARSGGDIPMADELASNLGIVSARNSVGGNATGSAKAAVQNATGTPISGIGLGKDKKLEDLFAGNEAYSGPKTDPFKDQLAIAYAPERQGRGVNDMHEAEAMGFAKGQSLSPQNHAWMDDIRDRAIAQANAEKLGGFSDWNTGNAQASNWVGKRINEGVVKPEDAGKIYADYWKKDPEAFATFEGQTGNAPGLNHLPESLNKSNDELEAALGGAWRNAYGGDILHTRAGFYPNPTQPAWGRYQGQSVPAEASTPFLAREKGGGDIIEPQQEALRTIEAVRAPFSAQNAGAVHWITDSKAPERTGAMISLPPEQRTSDMMKLLGDKFEGMGYDVASNPEGMTVAQFPGNEAAPPLGTTMAKAIAQALQEQGITGASARYGKAGSQYVDYSDLWGAPGKSPVTNAMLDQLDKTPLTRDALEHQDVRDAVGALNPRDQTLSESGWGPLNEKLMHLRDVFAKEGWAGVRREAAAGTVPAAMLMDPSIRAQITMQQQPDQSAAVPATQDSSPAY